TDELVPGWEGQIIEIPKGTGDPTYLLELDALSLDQLPEKYLADCILNEETPIAYYFEEADLEPSVRRDTDEQRRAAQDRVESLVFDIDEEDGLDRAILSQWQREFEQSPQFAALEPEAQESALSIIESFAEYAFNYRGDQPADWTIGTVREVCLELFPRKFTAKIEFFEQIGAVMTQFFGLLEEKALLSGAGRLQGEMRKIAPQVIKEAKNSSNWGMAKSFAMEALAEGVDMSDTDAMNRFMANFNANMVPNFGFPDFGSKKQQLLRPAQENPFKNISRNQIVKVKYQDGSVREGKFKRLEEELRSGKCTLVS
ncbi:MAG: hypothetical protein ACKVT2_06090, partial [Saprospiraceae bacterium]